MASAILPGGFPALADLARKFLEQIPPAHEAVANDARTDVARDHQLPFAIRHPIPVGPSLEIDLLDRNVHALLVARTASKGAPVRWARTWSNPAPCSSPVYSSSVRSFPSVQTSMLSDCICAPVGPLLSAASIFSAMRSPPPAGSASNTLLSRGRIFSSDQSCRIRPTA